MKKNEGKTHDLIRMFIFGIHISNRFAIVSKTGNSFRFQNREAEEAEQQRQLEEEMARAKEAKKEGMRKRKPVFTAKEKTDEELKGYSQLNMDLTKGTGVKAVETKVY